VVLELQGRYLCEILPTLLFAYAYASVRVAEEHVIKLSLKALLVEYLEWSSLREHGELVLLQFSQRLWMVHLLNSVTLALRVCVPVISIGRGALVRLRTQRSLLIVLIRRIGCTEGKFDRHFGAIGRVMALQGDAVLRNILRQSIRVVALLHLG